MSPLLQHQASKWRKRQADRVGETVRGNPFAQHAAAVADVGTAEKRAVAVEELSEGVAACLGLLLVEVAPSKSGHQGTRRGKKAQVVDSWEEEEDRLAASVDGALIPHDDL